MNYSIQEFHWRFFYLLSSLPTYFSSAIFDDYLGNPKIILTKSLIINKAKKQKTISLSEIYFKLLFSSNLNQTLNSKNARIIALRVTSIYTIPNMV